MNYQGSIDCGILASGMGGSGDREGKWEGKFQRHGLNMVFLHSALLQTAYLSVPKNQGGGGVLFGNNLPMNDLPYSKGFIKFRCLKPSKITKMCQNHT